MKNSWKILLLAICVVSVSACSSKSSDDTLNSVDEVEQVAPPETIYNEAEALLKKKNYRSAIEKFQEVERLHPYSKWSTKAQMMAAYTAYEQDDYDEAILALDRFIRLHPGNEDVDYALYLKAMSYYQQISDVSRDQEITRQALQSLNALVKRFPNSEYTRDAKLKRDLTLDHLAGKEMEVGRYYLNRNEINAAMNRFRVVVTNFQTTTHVPEALHRLVESYLILGLRPEARQVAAVLGHNYPGSKWYEDSYKILDEKSRQEILEDRSIVDKTIDSLFRPN